MIKRASSAKRGRRGILSRFLRNDAGNIMMLTAAMLIPLLALVGSGIDLGRIYVTKSRLQVACDAASLAGRRAVTAGSNSTAVSAEAIKFFNFNFPQNSYDSSSFTPTVQVTGGSTKVVVVTAATTLPMTIMKIFGYTTMPLSVTCNAQQDFVNTDIVLVLDTTGSMADKAVATDTESKIQGLRDAVMAFYDQLSPVQAQLAAAGLRMRIAVVPYASAVNVGQLVYAQSPANFSSLWAYQSRQIATAIMTNSQCNAVSGTRSGGICTYFNYTQVTPTLSQMSNYLAGNQVDITPIIGNSTDSTGVTPSSSGSSHKVTWAGCIEENQTDPLLMTATATSISPTAYDLQTAYSPGLFQWHPYWPEIEYSPAVIGFSGQEYHQPQVACPAAAAGMQWWTRDALQTYVNNLNPNGGTYHDNGMRWGIRVGAPVGIFGAQNPNTYGNMPVKRYIIFMTDGIMDTGYSTLYSSYGIEQYDKRITGGTNQTDQLNRHLRRFDLLCSAAKSDPYDYDIWVVGFAQTLDSHLSNCASNPSQASTAADSNALAATFVAIGKNIGALRLTQ